MTQSMETAAAAAPPWVPDDTTFGARLTLIRQHMRWTNVAQAARECGVPTDSWRNWEEGMEPRRLVTIAMAIATRTGCDLDWLVYGPSKATHLLRAENSHRHFPGTHQPVDAIAPRIVREAGHVTFGDGRKTRRTTSDRTSRIPSPRSHGSRPVSRSGVA